MRVDLPSSTEPQVLKRRMSMGAVGAVAVRTETEATAEAAEESMEVVGAITIEGESLDVAMVSARERHTPPFGHPSC